MLPLFLIGIMATICFANIPPEPVGEWNGSARYELAADFSLPSPDINATVFSCLREAGFKIVFLPVYNAYKSPYWILNAISNIPLAIQAGLGVEVYMVPNYHLFEEGPKQMTLFDEGSAQMTDILKGFESANFEIRRIWLKVKSREGMEENWNNTRAFFTQFISTARDFNIDVGFFTNRRNWINITNDWELEGHKLWYWNVRDVGPGGETHANFKDFRSFGGWTDPTVKQFAKKENICGVTVNWDVYDVHRLKHYGIEKI